MVGLVDCHNRTRLQRLGGISEVLHGHGFPRACYTKEVIGCESPGLQPQ